MNNTKSSTHRHERRVEITDVTPAMARTWLAHNTHNRPLRKNLVNSYAMTMKRGEWKLTAEPLAFSAPFTDPDSMKRFPATLMEGQHRLAAVVQSGVTIPATVWQNCDPDEFKVLGQGAARSPGDFLAINRTNLAEPYVVATVVGGFLRGALGLRTQIYPWMVAHILSHMERPVVVLSKYRKRLKRLFRRELTTAMLLAMMIDRERVISLLEQMEMGLGFKKDEPGYFLYRYLWDELASTKKDTYDVVFRRICVLLKLHLEREKIDSLPRASADGLLYLREQNKTKLNPLLLDLLGRVPDEFYNPQVQGARFKMPVEQAASFTVGGKA